jgi:hypothetical protein
MIPTIIDLIKTAMKLVNPGGTNRHGRRDDRSLASIAEHQPLGWLLPITTTDPEPGAIFFSTQVILGFYMQDSPNTSEEEREEIIRQMNELMTQFIGALRLLEKKHDVRSVRREPQYRQFSGTLSGVAVSFNYLTLEPC